MKTIPFSPDAVFPTELTTRRSAVFGISGSGKSNSATVIIEGALAAGEQVVLLDPKGEGYGLRTSADGKSEGFDVIVFGQPHGDVPELREEHAERVADFVVDSGRSVVLSMLGFEDDGQQRRFVTRFCLRLYRRKSQQAAKTRTLVVIEEAHLFVPEHASGGNAEMVGAIKRICRQGRTAGLGLLIVDQRPQEVAKSIISQCDLVICHQLTHPLDRKALHEWMNTFDTDGKGDVFLSEVAGLGKGVCWVWSPAWLNMFVKTQANRRTTFDSGATPDGTAAAITPTARASVNLDLVRKMMAAIPEPAEVTTMKELRQRLKEAREHIETLEKSNQTPVPVVAPELFKITERAQTQLDELLAILKSAAGAAGLVLVTPTVTAIRLLTPDQVQTAHGSPAPPAKAKAKPKKSRRRRHKRRSRRSASRRSKKLTPRQQRFLDAAFTLESKGNDVTGPAICSWLGIKFGGGSVDDDLRALAKAGLIARDKLNVKLTDGGRERGHLMGRVER